MLHTKVCIWESASATKFGAMIFIDGKWMDVQNAIGNPRLFDTREAAELFLLQIESLPVQ